MVKKYMHEDEASREIIGAAIEVHKQLGVVELKAVETLTPVHTAQMITYLKLTGCRLGLILNFNVPVMRDGIKRVAHNL